MDIVNYFYVILENSKDTCLFKLICKFSSEINIPYNK